MRKLHLVGFTPDRKGLIFSARRGSKSGGFLVPLEDSLLESLAAEQRRRNGPDTEVADTAESSAPTPAPSRSSRPQSTLTPREMQARLRAGRTIAEVAAEAGVTTDWVERFAIPILAEQAQMVELARSLTYSRSRGGESALPLGASVAENLAYRGVALPEDLFDNAWSAYQLHDVVWIVRVRYRSRGRLQEAAWELDVSSGHLTARNRLASELAFVEKGRRRKARPSPSAAPPEAAVPTPARAAAGRPPATKRSTTGPGASKRATTKRPATKRPATKRAATKRAVTKRAATKRAATKRVATPRAPAARTALPPRVRVGTDGTPSPPELAASLLAWWRRAWWRHAW
ncbi:MAG TPA: septation protein SepH [Acidimicrobiales bacterium]|nr:septation protein SepH [Acidimicrobiales bacterium]